MAYIKEDGTKEYVDNEEITPTIEAIDLEVKEEKIPKEAKKLSEI